MLALPCCFGMFASFGVFAGHFYTPVSFRFSSALLHVVIILSVAGSMLVRSRPFFGIFSGLLCSGS